ncbi:universal stress protein [Texcoconibacillus texcoconensis]|uniref:Nucleotide-binding universal stress UspA family protein n=1 Tax=Texcoconibacillus texcoconensis TaxID=1095777 RepID=A0A840QRB5_9BACI|nr:universal stress protein [Texcoconibacillus texcoconensis]MBB5174006.1 nucleotide-binding universal stress UspA family protein [Texcoconibacillus texcoconensis]
MFKHVLLAADGSDHSLRATEKAIGLISTQDDSFMTVFYAVDTQTAKTDVLHHYDGDMLKEERKKRLAGVEEMLQKANVNYEIVERHGEPGPAIVQFANESEFDAVVVGSRGLNGFQEMVLGSVSHKVAKRVEAPVMIVK